LKSDLFALSDDYDKLEAYLKGELTEKAYIWSQLEDMILKKHL